MGGRPCHGETYRDEFSWGETWRGDSGAVNVWLPKCSEANETLRSEKGEINFLLLSVCTFFPRWHVLSRLFFRLFSPSRLSSIVIVGFP